jgi:LPXTG-motif cell wall-anchored protein
MLPNTGNPGASKQSAARDTGYAAGGIMVVLLIGTLMISVGLVLRRYRKRASW